MYEFDDFDTQIQVDELTPPEYEIDDDVFFENDDDLNADSFNLHDDDAEAFASAGFGTDEDYGFYGHDDY